MVLTPPIEVKSLAMLNHALPLAGDRWQAFREQLPDMQHVDEIVFACGRVGKCGPRTEEIP